jgi:phosphoribosyl-dephospho-CoA transferase
MNSLGQPAEAALVRHRLVRVARDAWQACVSSRADLRNEPLIRDWGARGWPLIVRRAGPCDAGVAGVPLGLPLPPSAGKRRVAVTVPADAIESVELPPTLASLRDIAPAKWRATIDALDAVARHHRVGCHAFGSLAWQRLTGLHYLSEQSDLDILLDLPTAGEVPVALAALLADVAVCDELAPMRIDGEIIRMDGAGVNWRELHAGVDEVVVKASSNVVLASPRAFVEGK